MTKTFADAELFRLLQSDADLPATCGFARLPHRRTILRRLKSLTHQAEQQIAVLDAEIPAKVAATQSPSVSAIDARQLSGSRRKAAQKASPTKTDSARPEKCRCRIQLVQKRL